METDVERGREKRQRESERRRMGETEGEALMSNKISERERDG